MSVSLNYRWGECIGDPTEQQMQDALDQLDVEDIEHQSVSIVHESEWCLGAYRGGLLVWEHVEGELEPRHMNNVSRERVLELWRKLMADKLDEIEREHWLPGYEDPE